jgi:hypothetical protein
VDPDLLESGTAVTLLAARVATEQVRASISKCEETVTDLHYASSEETAEEDLPEAIASVDHAQELIGAVLRRLPPPTAYRPIVTSPFVGPADDPTDG